MNLFKIKKNHLIIHRDDSNNTLIFDFKYTVLALTVLIGSLIAQLLNHQYYHYHGNNYINGEAYFAIILYSIINIIGCRVLPEFQRFTAKFLDFFLVMMTFLFISFATNSVQYTPFAPIDNYLHQFELFKLEVLVDYVNHNEYLQRYLFVIYNSLLTVMIITPFSLIILNRRTEVHNFCRFLLLAVIIGFGIYYFYPSCGPASVFKPSIFLEMQHANHIKFWEIHQNKIPTTLDGGLIALPSFHVLLAWACLRMYKTVNFYVYFALFIWFFLICLSCLLLGWHYSTDIILSIIIALLLEKVWVTQS